MGGSLCIFANPPGQPKAAKWSTFEAARSYYGIPVAQSEWPFFVAIVGKKPAAPGGHSQAVEQIEWPCWSFEQCQKPIFSERCFDSK
tara:strand:+ start:53 stop:313 length:261 start_codon:yes stop_codon:yes gene_type:complete